MARGAMDVCLRVVKKAVNWVRQLQYQEPRALIRLPFRIVACRLTFLEIAVS